MSEPSKDWLCNLNETEREKIELAQYFIKCYIAAREGLMLLRN